MKRAFQEKDYGVSAEALEWGSKYLHKSERGDENSIKYMRMSSTPSPPPVINDPSLKIANLVSSLVRSNPS